MFQCICVGLPHDRMPCTKKQDPRGRTPLFFAVSDGASEGVIKELLKYAKNVS